MTGQAARAALFEQFKRETAAKPKGATSETLTFKRYASAEEIVAAAATAPAAASRAASSSGAAVGSPGPGEAATAAAGLALDDDFWKDDENDDDTEMEVLDPMMELMDAQMKESLKKRTGPAGAPSPSPSAESAKNA